jgi:DNA-binding MarR family transcriptional regulator
MESLTKRAVVKVMKVLYSKKRLYASQIARELDLTVRHLDRILPKMVQDGLIREYRERNRKYCELTERGKSLLWALNNLDDLTALSSMEETAKVEGRVKPFEQDFLKNEDSFFELASKFVDAMSSKGRFSPDLRKLEKILKERKTRRGH